MRLIALLLLLLLMFAGAASASVIYYPDSDYVFITYNSCTNLTEVYDALVSQHNASYVETNIVNETSPKVWTMHTTIRQGNGMDGFYINNSDCTHLTFTDGYTGWSLIYGAYYIDGVTIDSESSTRGIKMSQGSITDSSFTKCGGITVNDNHDGVFKNITFIDGGWSVYTFYFGDCENITIENMTLTNLTGTGIWFDTVHNSSITDVTIQDAGDYTNPSTQKFGITLQFGYNNHAENIYINGSGWSTLSMTESEHSSSFKNCTVYNSGHNGLDLHGGQHDVLIENVSIYDSVSNNILIMGSLFNGTYNLTLRDIVSSGAAGDSMYITRYIRDTTIINFTAENRVELTSCWNITLLNATIVNSSTGVLQAIANEVPDLPYSPAYPQYGYYGNYTVIDSVLYNSSSSDVYNYRNSNNLRLLNTNYTTVGFHYNAINSSMAACYYVDVLAQDANGDPIDSAIITFTNLNSSDYANSSVDGWGTPKTSFTTDSSGHTPLPTIDRTNSPALLEYWRNMNGSANHYYTIEVSAPDGSSGSVTNVHPNVTWYREDAATANDTQTISTSGNVPCWNSTNPVLVTAAQNKHVYNRTITWNDNRVSSGRIVVRTS